MPPAKTGGIFPKLGGAIPPPAVNHPGEVEAGVTHQDFWTKQKYTTASVPRFHVMQVGSISISRAILVIDTNDYFQLNKHKNSLKC